MGGGRRGSDHLHPGSSSEVAMEEEESSTSSMSSSYSEGESSLILHDPKAQAQAAPRAAEEDGDEEEGVARRRRRKTHLLLMQSYETSGARAPSLLQDAKNAIRSHKPGDWIEEAGGTKAGDYQVPDTIALLLVGPRGSGKSSLVNRITRVFEEEPFSPVRAQVSHNLLATDGSCFLQEYMIPGNSMSLCVYDTRSLSMIPSDNLKLLERWMTRGVCHGEMVIRDSDADVTRRRIRAMSRQGLFCPCQKRTVNFVIFVVNGKSVLKSMDGKDTQYIDMVVETFNYPFMSFKDNKPVVVVTHGDELPLTDRARVRTHLGELLGVPPAQQIFDIPDSSDHVTSLAIVDMLQYSIKHADINLPYKQSYLLEGQRILLQLMDRLQGFDVWILIVEVVMICLCFLILLLRRS